MQYDHIISLPLCAGRDGMPSGPLILPTCGLTAANVALGLVYVQKLTHLMKKRRTDPRQPLSEVFMYGGFGNAELLGGGADGRTVIYDILRQIAGTLLNICIQLHHSPYSRVNVYVPPHGDMKQRRSCRY